MNKPIDAWHLEQIDLWYVPGKDYADHSQNAGFSRAREMIEQAARYPDLVHLVDASQLTTDQRNHIYLYVATPGAIGFRYSIRKVLRSRRRIPLPATLVRALQGHRTAQAVERLAQGPAYTAHDLVFATTTGQPLEERNLVNQYFKPVVRAAGLPEALRFYDLRHTCATLLLAQGEHPKVVSERLGHASITLTMDTYSHVLPTMQEAATARLEETLFGSSVGKQKRP